MDDRDFIVPASKIASRDKIGGKAATLAELNRKFKIPEWFVISPLAFLASLTKDQKESLKNAAELKVACLSEEIKNVILNATKMLGEDQNSKFAVRSSATAEDGELLSFAGQLDSYLNISLEDVPEKVKDVWNSAFSDRVSHYRKNFGHNENWIPAVIVQRMVDAEFAGVAFSADPVTGDQKTCIINVTAGLADKLVSGEVNGDTYYLTREANLKKEHLCGPLRILTKEVMGELIELLLKVEKHFGIPQDIEWAIEGNKIFLLQARPITALKKSTKMETPTVWDNSNIVESYSGVTSPLTFSFARYVYEHVYIEFCKFMGVSSSKIARENEAFRSMLGFVNGHVYYNLLNWYRVLSLFPGFKMNRKFMEQMMGVKEPLPEDYVESIVPNHPSQYEKIADSLNFMLTLGGLVAHQVFLRRTIKLFYIRLNTALSSSNSLSDLNLKQLAQEYRTLESRLLKSWDAPLINDFLCMIAFGLSRKVLENSLGEDGLKFHNDIMIGQGDIVSAEPAIRIRKMAQTAAKYPEIARLLTEGNIAGIEACPEIQKEYHDYLKKFGDRCLQELKLESSTLHDDPKMLLRAIGNMAQRKQEPEKEKSHINLEREISNLIGNRIFRKRIVLWLVTWAKSRVRDRENLRFERTRVFGRVRQIFLAIGKKLVEIEYLKNSRDIFYLEVQEVLAVIEGTSVTADIKSLVELRKKQELTFSEKLAPPNRFETLVASSYEFQNQTFSYQPTSFSLDSMTAKGLGCCQGVVRATVRVIRDPRDAELKAGEIMVAQFTDPGWITLFSNASGILVERGSLLSHSAIVAREMGIPAIVAIDGIMEWLHTGDLVEMNGSTGVVTKLRKLDNNE